MREPTRESSRSTYTDASSRLLSTEFQQLRWILLEHHVEFAVREPPVVHRGREGAGPFQARVLAWLAARPELRNEAALRTDLANRIGPPAGPQGVPEIELD